MNDDELKFRWVKIHAGWWECPRYRLSVVKNKQTGEWSDTASSRSGATHLSHDTALAAKLAREARFIEQERRDLAEMESGEMINQANGDR